MARKRQIRKLRTKKPPVRKLQQGGHTHDVNHRHPGWYHSHGTRKYNLEHTHATGSNGAVQWPDNPQGWVSTMHEGSQYIGSAESTGSSWNGGIHMDFRTDEAGAHSGHLFNQNQSVRGGGNQNGRKGGNRPRNVNSPMIDLCIQEPQLPECQDPRWGLGGSGTRRRGGRAKPKRRMVRGRKMARGGRTKPVPNRKFARGGNTLKRKFQNGGMTMNSGCRHHTSKYDCDAAAGCSWDFNNTCCN